MDLCGRTRLTHGGVNKPATHICAGLSYACAHTDTDIPKWLQSWNAQQALEQKRPKDAACGQSNVKAQGDVLGEVACQLDLGDRIWGRRGEMEMHC